MNLIGIDPGIARTGWGIVETKSSNPKPICFDCIETKAALASEKRILTLYKSLNEIISLYKPQEAAIESLFFNTNAKTAIKVGEARGVVLLSLAQNNIPVFNYTPLQIKIAVTGYGRAQKLQMQKMVKVLLNLEKIPKPDDVADALAVALTHAYSRKNIHNG